MWLRFPADLVVAMVYHKNALTDVTVTTLDTCHVLNCDSHTSRLCLLFKTWHFGGCILLFGRKLVGPKYIELTKQHILNLHASGEHMVVRCVGCINIGPNWVGSAWKNSFQNDVLDERRRRDIFCPKVGNNGIRHICWEACWQAYIVHNSYPSVLKMYCQFVRWEVLLGATGQDCCASNLKL
jgi:hypothetical protein